MCVYVRTSSDGDNDRRVCERPVDLLTPRGGALTLDGDPAVDAEGPVAHVALGDERGPAVGYDLLTTHDHGLSCQQRDTAGRHTDGDQAKHNLFQKSFSQLAINTSA